MSLISAFKLTHRLRRMLSRVVVVKGVRRDDHVTALLGPALRVFLHILELATLLEAF